MEGNNMVDLGREVTLEFIRVTEAAARSTGLPADVPVATGGGDNMMGAIGGWRGRCHVGLHQNIADMNLVLRPDLHVLDCTRILLRNGPSGGDVNDVAVKNLVFAGPDPVALDAQGTALFGLTPEDIGYISRAHALGLGEMDLSKVKIV